MANEITLRQLFGASTLGRWGETAIVLKDNQSIRYNFMDNEITFEETVPRLEAFKILAKHSSVTPSIERVIFNDPATIVFWSDGSKTVVKTDREPFDKEKGLAMAISKKYLGNKGNYFNTFKKWIY